ncbi:MAG: TonB-dependent receptor plug domain-containing protein [Bacteroidales bacterium]
MKKYLLIKALLISIFSPVTSQNNIKLHISDSHSGEALVGASIINLQNYNTYLTSNFGYVLVPYQTNTDTLQLLISYIGYADTVVNLNKTDSIVSIKLSIKPTEIEEVFVQGSYKNPTHGQIQLSARELQSIPILFAEHDVLKSIQTLPGIQQNREGTSNFSVRGGNFDQNLILLDGIPVYNINHLFGFVSVISTDAVNQATLYKGGIPARYGNRLSSVIDITLREGNKEHLTGSFGVGILSAKVTIEGPLKNRQGSFLINARRTPYDLIVAPLSTIWGNRLGYYYQDLVAKINFPLNSQNTVFLSAYYGADKVYRAEFAFDPQTMTKFRITWGNITTAIRWTNNSIPNTLSNVTVAYTRYRYLNDIRSYDQLLPSKPIEKMGYFSSISDIITRWNISYVLSPSHQINIGIDNSFHIFNTGTNYAENQDTSASFGDYYLHNETNTFIEDVFQWNRITSTLGIRATNYQLKNKSYFAIQPRFLLTLRISPKTTLSASYNRMFQFLHLYANSNIGMPTDLWIPVSKNIPPSSCDQYSAGFKTTLRKITISNEIFFKDMKNVSDYRNDIILNNTQINWDNILSIGKGLTYGTEWFIDYHHSRFDVSLAYTFSRSFRKHHDIKQGSWFPYTYDRPHNINLISQWKISQNKQFNASWTYASGYMITVSEGNYYLGRKFYPDLSNRNNFRTPAVHHLDVTYSTSKEKKKGTQTWTFGIYNLYGRNNPFGYMYNITDLNNNSFENPKLQFVSLFTFVPFIAYEFKFK